MPEPPEWPMRGLEAPVFCATLGELRAVLRKRKGGHLFLRLVESQRWPPEGMWLVPARPPFRNTKTRRT